MLLTVGLMILLVINNTFYSMLKLTGLCVLVASEEAVLLWDGINLFEVLRGAMSVGERVMFTVVISQVRKSRACEIVSAEHYAYLCNIQYEKQRIKNGQMNDEFRVAYREFEEQTKGGGRRVAEVIVGYGNNQ